MHKVVDHFGYWCYEMDGEMVKIGCAVNDIRFIGYVYGEEVTPIYRGVPDYVEMR